MAQSRNLFFQDNESAREALIRSYSPSCFSREIILACKISDMHSEALDWRSRVPTQANIADGPSRLDFSALSKFNAVIVDAIVPAVQSLSNVDNLQDLANRTCDENWEWLVRFDKSF